MSDDFPRLVDFVILGTEPTVKVRVRDVGGDAVLRVKLVVRDIRRVGNAPDTGFPTYEIRSETLAGIIECDKALRAKPSQPQLGYR